MLLSSAPRRECRNIARIVAQECRSEVSHTTCGCVCAQVSPKCRSGLCVGVLLRSVDQKCRAECCSEGSVIEVSICRSEMLLRSVAETCRCLEVSIRSVAKECRAEDSMRHVALKSGSEVAQTCCLRVCVCVCASVAQTCRSEVSVRRVAQTCVKNCRPNRC